MAGKKDIHRIIRMLIVLLMGITLAGPRLHAQSQSINATISGQITDENGAGVPDAKVTAMNADMGFQRSATSDSSGQYVIPELPLGTYSVVAEKDGFQLTKHVGIGLQAGQQAAIDLKLTLGSTSTQIVVSGAAPVINPDKTDIGRTLTSIETTNLPLTSRNPYNFILFQPAVSGHPNPELGIPRTLNTNGVLDRINYQLDGMVDTETDQYGLRLFPISDVYIREIQTVSSSFAPEFGGTVGDIFNVITNSGTNQIHGMAQYLGRPTALEARPFLLSPSQPKPNLTQNDFSGNIGGPAIKDKLFYFGAYEHLVRGIPSPNSIKPSVAAAVGVPSSLLATPLSIEHAQFVDARGDWNINSKNQFFVRYNYFRNVYPNNSGVGGVNALDAAADFQDRAHVIGAQLLTTFSNNLLNEFRASWPYRNERHVNDPLTGPGPQILISGQIAFNGTIAAGSRFAEKIPSFNDNLTYIVGAHTLKFGVGWEKINDTQVQNIYSQYVFPSIAAYQEANSGANPYSYTVYNAVIGFPGDSSYHSLFWDSFAQDSWQAKPNLMVVYGVRFDHFAGPPGDPNALFVYSQHFHVPAMNWSPRVGVSWQVAKRTVLHANTGIFYDAPPTDLWFNAIANDGSNRAFIANLAPTTPFAPAFPKVFNSLPSSFALVTPSITTVTPNFKNAYTLNSSVQITQQLAHNDAFTLGFVGVQGRQQEYLHNMNLINPVSTLADGRPVFSTVPGPTTRLYPKFNNILLEDVGSTSNYNALFANYEHRWSTGFEMNASYTWSHTIDDAPGVNSFEQNLPIEDPTDLHRDRGNSYVNRPNAFTLSSVFQPQIHLENRLWNQLAQNNTLAVLGNISSGDEQNITTNRILNGDTTTGSVTRPLFIARNTVRGPNIYQIDTRYTRTVVTIKGRVHPQFFVEANNVFNHQNITALNTVVPVTAAGAATLPKSFTPLSSVLEARILQFGATVTW